HHLARAVGKMLVQPCAENWCYLVRKPDWQIEAAACPCLRTGLDKGLELMIGYLRNDWSNGDVTGHARVVQRLDRSDTPVRRGRSRLESSRNLRIERRHRQSDRHDAQLR